MHDLGGTRGDCNRLRTNIRNQRDAVGAQIAGEVRQIAFTVEVMYILTADDEAAEGLAQQADVRVAGGARGCTRGHVDADVGLADRGQAAAQIFGHVEDDARRIVRNTGLRGVRPGRCTGRTGRTDTDIFQRHFEDAADRHAGLRQRETGGRQRASYGYG